MAMLTAMLFEFKSYTIKSRKPSNPSPLPDHNGFYGIILKSAAFYYCNSKAS